MQVSGKIAERGRAIAKRKLNHLLELQRTGHWSIFYTENDFQSQLDRATIDLADWEYFVRRSEAPHQTGSTSEPSRAGVGSDSFRNPVAHPPMLRVGLFPLSTWSGGENATPVPANDGRAAGHSASQEAPGQGAKYQPRLRLVSGTLGERGRGGNRV
jgi:hypothetical protein